MEINTIKGILYFPVSTCIIHRRELYNRFDAEFAMVI